MSCIYGIINSEGVIRYIGKTIHTAEKRLKHHLKDAKYGCTYRLHKWLRSIDYVPDVIILEHNPINLEVSEIAWIALYRSLKYDLTNHTVGGDGLRAGSKHTPEAIEKLRKTKAERSPEAIRRTAEAISAANKGHVAWNKGKKGVQVPWNKETIGSQVAWNKGLTTGSLTEEHKSDIAVTLKLAYQNEELREKLKSRQQAHVDLDLPDCKCNRHKGKRKRLMLEAVEIRDSMLA